MSDTTRIEWAHATFNPWIGCTKVSEGCARCYAETLDRNRYSKTMDGGTKENPISHWGKGAPRHRTKGWNRPLQWNAECEVHPGYPHRVFPSLCDWLDEEVPIEWLADFLQLIHDTPALTWLLLTKRPENFIRIVKAAMSVKANDSSKDKMINMVGAWGNGLPPKNVWMGVSIENQKRADERIPRLLNLPAVTRFLSVEPLLSQVNLSNAILPARDAGCFNHVDWVIVGAESGSGRRDCGVDAILKVADECVKNCVPVFVKQDCAQKDGQQGRIPDSYWKLKQIPK